MYKQDLERIEKTLQTNTDAIRELTKAINELSKTCGRMDNHINFVEDTYESLKRPLNFLRSVTSLQGNTAQITEE